MDARVRRVESNFIDAYKSIKHLDLKLRPLNVHMRKRFREIQFHLAFPAVQRDDRAAIQLAGRQTGSATACSILP
jgi:hypothetical protein